MNLVALKKLNRLVSYIWGEKLWDYVNSLGLEYDPEKPFFDFLQELNDRGDEGSIIQIINSLFMDTDFRQRYTAERRYPILRIFQSPKVYNVANELVELLQMEGYEVEDFRVHIEKGHIVRPNVKLVDDKFVVDKFYLDLVQEINRSYRYGLPSATWILLRKILENLLIDSLRQRYGTAKLDLFYWKERRRFHDFSKLLSNFKSNLADFKPFSSALNDEVINRLAIFKEIGNSNAHSIDVLVTIESIDKQKDQINHLIHLLYELIRKIKGDKT